MESWFDKPITHEIACAFFDELWTYTREFIINYAREIKDIWPPSSEMPINDFNPKGAIIHTSNTTSMWNALHMLTSNVYGSHCLIMAQNHSKNNMRSYPLLREMPTMVLTPYHMDDTIKHSGYLSEHAYGIELRTVGRLRPAMGETLPPPILPVEEHDHVFQWNEEDQPDFYTSDNMWRTPFEGPVYQYQDNFFELPTRNQIIAMLIVLKVLNAYTHNSFENKFIIPGNCVHATTPILPGVPWDLVRQCTMGKQSIQQAIDQWINPVFTVNPCTFESEDIEHENAGMLSEQLDKVRWRGELDDGQLLMLFDTEREYKIAMGYRFHLQSLGYHADDLSNKIPETSNFAMQLYAISRGLGDKRESDVYTRLQHELNLGV